MKEFIEGMMNLKRAERINYEDMLTRWLVAKRDYPWNNEPEPSASFFTVFLYRDDIILEFQRTI